MSRSQREYVRKESSTDKDDIVVSISVVTTDEREAIEATEVFATAVKELARKGINSTLGVTILDPKDAE